MAFLLSSGIADRSLWWRFLEGVVEDVGGGWLVLFSPEKLCSAKDSRLND